MRSQLSEEDSCRGTRASGALPSLRTVSCARTAIWCTSGLRWTSMSRSVNVTAFRSASLAMGAVTFCGVVPGPAWVVVWPFSSIDREKITCPFGELCGAVCVLSCGSGGVFCLGTG